MGREVRRVPVDFDWPINKVWDGFVLPESLRANQCIDCGGRGQTPARRWVDQLAWLLGSLDDDLRAQQRGQRMHPYYGSTGPFIDDRDRPSPDIAEFCTGLAGEPNDNFLGRNTSDAYRLTRKLVALAGLDDETWGWCPACKGQGYIEKYVGQDADAEAWEPTEPPTGDGWQVWETVSEGSPISPVCPDREGLIGWLMSPAYSWGTSKPLTREQAEHFTADGWAPTFIFSASTGLVNGEQFMGGES